jgi:gamma-glutamylcyclotransferase (GGCT)/AIG2-like uncharacterized protein YtfP
MHLFAYGTLTFPEVWDRISVGTFPSRPAVLHGYAMYRVKDAVYPGILLSNPDAEVPGVLYDDLDEDTLFELDTYESSFYNRLPVKVVVEDGSEVECHAYVVPHSRRDLLTNEHWDKEWFRAHELDRYLNG